MTKQWTDADVAKMLGWRINHNGDWMHKSGDIWLFFPTHNQRPSFGLSTPPGPEADANVARYVLPWIRSQKPKFRIRLADRIASEFRGFQADHLFNLNGPTLCRAALEASNA